jgi:hypothetical protein
MGGRWKTDANLGRVQIVFRINSEFALRHFGVRPGGLFHVEHPSDHSKWKMFHVEQTSVASIFPPSPLRGKRLQGRSRKAFAHGPLIFIPWLKKL